MKAFHPKFPVNSLNDEMRALRSFEGYTCLRIVFKRADDEKVSVNVGDIHGRQLGVEANIKWAETLEAAGIHVTYGVVGLKTHGKVIFVVRRDYNACSGMRTSAPAIRQCHPEMVDSVRHRSDLHVDVAFAGIVLRTWQLALDPALAA